MKMNKILLFLLYILFVQSIFSDEYTITASSELVENIGGKPICYSVDNLSDNDLSTAWVEGEENNGIGEFLNISFKEQTYVGRLYLYNGFQKSEDLFYKNNRVLKLKVLLNGNYERIFYFYDTNMKLTVPVEQEVESIKLVIMDVYHGYKYSDTCISELEVDYTNLGYFKLDGDTEKQKHMIKLSEDFRTGILSENKMLEILDYIKIEDTLDGQDPKSDGIALAYALRLKDKIHNKEFWTAIIDYDSYYSSLGSSYILGRKTFFIEIADDIDLNGRLSEGYQNIYEIGDLFVEELYSDSEIILFKKIHGYPPLQIENKRWHKERFSFSLNGSMFPIRKKTFPKKGFQKNDLIEFACISAPMYWDRIEINNPKNLEGEITIIIDDLFGYTVDISEFSELPIGMNVTYLDIQLNLSGTEADYINLTPVFGNNWVD